MTNSSHEFLHFPVRVLLNLIWYIFCLSHFSFLSQNVYRQNVLVACLFSGFLLSYFQWLRHLMNFTRISNFIANTASSFLCLTHVFQSYCTKAIKKLFLWVYLRNKPTCGVIEKHAHPSLGLTVGDLQALVFSQHSAWLIGPVNSQNE